MLLISNRITSIAFSRNLVNSESVGSVPSQHELFQYLYLFRRFEWVIILFSFFIISSSIQCLLKQYSTKMLPARSRYYLGRSNLNCKLIMYFKFHFSLFNIVLWLSNIISKMIKLRITFLIWFKHLIQFKDYSRASFIIFIDRTYGAHKNVG